LPLDRPGLFTIFGRVLDVHGDSADFSTVVEALHVPPSATFAKDGDVDKGGTATVRFTGASSPSHEATAAGFHYSFGMSPAELASSYTAAGAASTHDFMLDRPGTFILYGRVIDVHGDFADFSVPVVSRHVPPKATFDADKVVDEGSLATARFTGASSPSQAATAAGFHYSFALDRKEALASTYAAAGTSATASFLLDRPGTFTIWGRVLDVDGDSADFSTTVEARHVPPSATFAKDGDVDKGSLATVRFTDASSPSHEATLAGFRYSFALEDKKDLASSYAAAGTSPSASFLLDRPGSFMVYGRVIDVHGDFNDFSVSVVSRHVMPTATFAADGVVDEGSQATVRFTGASSPSFYATNVAGFHYDFALDKTKLASTYAKANTSPAASFLLDEPGTFTIWGRIIDVDDDFSDFPVSVVSRNVKPTATLGNIALDSMGRPTDHSAVDVGSQTRIAFTDAYSPSGDATRAGFHYSFALNPAGLATSYADATSDTGLSLTFDQPKSYTILGRVLDNHGDFMDYAIPVVVLEVLPMATLSVANIDVGQTETASLTNVKSPSNRARLDGFHYSFALTQAGLAPSYDDASPEASHTFPVFNTQGMYPIFARIWDEFGGFTEYKQLITVRPLVPTATFRSAGDTDEGGLATVTFTNPRSPSGKTHFDYSFARSRDGLGNTYGAAPSASFPLDSPGTATLWGRVRDENGAFMDYSVDVAARRVRPTANFQSSGLIQVGQPAVVFFTDAHSPSQGATQAGFHYAIDFRNDGKFEVGDGTYAGSVTRSAFVVPANFLPAGAGTLTVRGLIIDRDGNVNEYITVITVQAPIPTPVGPKVEALSGPALPRLAPGTGGVPNLGLVPADLAPVLVHLSDPSLAAARAGLTPRDEVPPRLEARPGPVSSFAGGDLPRPPRSVQGSAQEPAPLAHVRDNATGLAASVVDAGDSVLVVEALLGSRPPEEELVAWRPPEGEPEPAPPTVPVSSEGAEAPAPASRLASRAKWFALPAAGAAVALAWLWNRSRRRRRQAPVAATLEATHRP
jgi:hypothetical protein